MGRKGLTIVEFVIILILIGLLIAIYLPAFKKEAPKKRSAGAGIGCVRRLKDIKTALLLYANENDQRYPPIDNIKNNFIFDANLLYPEHLELGWVAGCPSDLEFDPYNSFRLSSPGSQNASDRDDHIHPDCITDMSYCYLGWIVTSDEEAEAFFEAYDTLAPEEYHEDIIVPDGKGNGGSNIIHRLDPGAERFFDDPSKTAADIPIIWDKPSTDLNSFSHVDRKDLSNATAGGNVIYQDGHFDYIKYPGKFPMTETMARLLDERPREPIPDCE